MDRTVAEALMEVFCKMYVDSEVVGIVPSDQIKPVVLNGICLSDQAPGRAKEAGCPDGTLAIIAGFADPSESGITSDRLPPAPAWICFPDDFNDLPVFYFPCEVAEAYGAGGKEPR